MIQVVINPFLALIFISGKLLGEYKRLQREENNENKSYLHHIPPSLAN